MITTGSLCTGYDGLGRALELAGLDVAPLWFVENEASVAHVLKHEHPLVPNVGDVRTAQWHLAPHVNVLTSGDPCQSISVAGRRLGREDPRFLWPWVRAAYRAVRPDAIFFENVAGILAHDGGRTLAERFAHLRKDGYAVRWTVLGACVVGAPHHRHRWYALAGYVGANVPEAIRVGGAKAICGAPRSGGRVLLPSPTASDHFGAGRGPAKTGGENLRTAVSLLPTPRATVRPIGGPNQRNGRGEHDALPGLVVNMLPTPTTSNAHGNDLNSRGELLLPGIVTSSEVWGKYAEAVALWGSITGTPAPEPTEPGARGGRRLSAALPEWMMGVRPGLLTERMGRSDALKAAGNGVVPQAAAAAYRLLSRGSL